MNKSQGRLIAHLPNTLTALNLFSGALATVFALQGALVPAALLILAGFFFDLTDGLTARLLKVQSAIGKELDSLADLISFGMAPAAILFTISLRQSGELPLDFSQPLSTWWVFLIPFILPVFAGLRLAKFNVDENQTDHFSGLPTPANGLMVLVLPLVLRYQPDSFLISWLESAWFIPCYSLIISLLMVSRIRLHSLKMKGFSWRQSRFTYLLILLCLPLIVGLGLTGIFFIIPVYVVYTMVLAKIRLGRHS
ncbi:MAG: CDP-diacylglycerol--serine O-phosphatidyltransferase [Bacteroidales bacterium]|jgi:CDP-diacylglycerol--serine O-phosphatidyltransferase